MLLQIKKESDLTNYKLNGGKIMNASQIKLLSKMKKLIIINKRKFVIRND